MKSPLLPQEIIRLEFVPAVEVPVSAAVATATATAAAVVVAVFAWAIVATAATMTRAAFEPATTTARLAWLSFFHHDRRAVQLGFVQAINSSQCFVVVGHFDECETSGATCFVVHNDFRRIHYTECFEGFLQVFALCPEIEFCYKNVHQKKIDYKKQKEKNECVNR
ncbi:MAG: hypothetical protein RL181_2295 [Bacteroidota bacterium]